MPESRPIAIEVDERHEAHHAVGEVPERSARRHRAGEDRDDDEHAVAGEHRALRGDELDVRLAVVVVAEDRGEREQEDDDAQQRCSTTRRGVDTIASCVRPMPRVGAARSGTETRMMNAVMEQTRKVSK